MPRPPVEQKEGFLVRGLATVRIRDKQELADLFTDLHEATRQSLRTGGSYTVTRRSDTGTLSIEIWL